MQTTPAKREQQYRHSPLRGEGYWLVCSACGFEFKTCDDDDVANPLCGRCDSDLERQFERRLLSG